MSGIFPDSGVPPTDANNSLPNPDTVNCPTELWHSTSRCTPRFDPAAANAIMSEILNVMACADIPYDCSKLDNLCTALKDLIGDQLYGCLPRQFPSASGACTIEQLVLTTDAVGCKKIARYSASSSSLGVCTAGDWYGAIDSQRPLDPNAPATFYNAQQLIADINANTVNNALLSNNALTKISFNMVCAGYVDIKMMLVPIFNPNQAGAPNGARSAWVMRRDGKMELSPSGYLANISQNFTNYLAAFEHTLTLWFDVGSHSLEFYVIASSAGLPPVPVRIAHYIVSPTVESSSLICYLNTAVV